MTSEGDMIGPSPLQNRIAPDGAVHAVPARGTMMGNRGGRLHDSERRLGRRRWATRAWICCEIAFRGRRRAVMGDGYTELFFLDEATALAAGHRPCYECRRADAQAFALALARALGLDAPPSAPRIDRLLHAERTSAGAEVDPRDLPDGAMIETESGAFLIRGERMRRWSFECYGPAEPPPARARLLTPPTIVAALAAGYRPRLHVSALR